MSDIQSRYILKHIMLTDGVVHQTKCKFKHRCIDFLKSMLLCFIGVLFFTACNVRPETVLDREQMTDILVDVHKAEALLDEQSWQYETSEEQQAVMAAVFIKNHVSREQYDSSLVWYSQNLKELIRVYDQVKLRLRAQDDSIMAEIRRSNFTVASHAGDSVELWLRRPYEVLDPQRLAMHTIWEIPSDSNFYKADTIVWSFRLQALDTAHYAVATLSLEMPGDTLISVVNPSLANGRYCLTVVGDSAHVLQRVIGSIHILNHESESPFSMPVYLDEISVKRYHKKQSE